MRAILCQCTRTHAATATCTETSKETCVSAASSRIAYYPPCRGTRLKPPVHQAACRAVLWARERNKWGAAHPEIDPPLSPVPERKVRAHGQQWNSPRLRRGLLNPQIGSPALPDKLPNSQNSQATKRPNPPSCACVGDDGPPEHHLGKTPKDHGATRGCHEGQGSGRCRSHS